MKPQRASCDASEAEISVAQAQGFVEGGIDRVTGKIDSMVGAVDRCANKENQECDGNCVDFFVRDMSVAC